MEQFLRPTQFFDFEHEAVKDFSAKYVSSDMTPKRKGRSFVLWRERRPEIQPIRVQHQS